MNFSDEFSDNPLDLEDFLEDAVHEILSSEDYARYMRWVQENIRHYFAEDFPVHTIPQDHIKALGLVLGLNIWNATPLPGNDFRPRPVALPERNMPCICGSGRKYKKCCRKVIADFPWNGTEIEEELVWFIVVEKLPFTTLNEALARNRIPLLVVSSLAREYMEVGLPKKGLGLLEPFFAENLTQTDYGASAALDSLLDIYNELGYWKKKERLLARITDEVKKSPLRSNAYQRLATMRMNAGDHEGAWAAFQHAHRDTPDDPAVGGLEIHFLLTEGKHDQARQRADFWRRKLEKMGYTDDADSYRFFVEASEDPVELMRNIEMHVMEGEGAALQEWLDAVRDRPLPEYAIVSLSDGPDEMSRQGSAGEDCGGTQLVLPFAESEPGEDSVDSIPVPPQSEDTHELVAPAAVREVEEEWCRVFPLAKPFSIQVVPSGGDSPWEPDIEMEWMAFLESYPEAFDSIDILDDLASAMQVSSYEESFQVYKSIIRPILERSRAIVHKAVDACEQPPRLAWVHVVNRPALRNLFRLYLLLSEEGEEEEALRIGLLMLELNPDDNHGMRAPVVNMLLKREQYDLVIGLTEVFQGDLLVETVLGRVLAFYRLGRMDEAQAAVAEAMERHALVIRNLWRKRVRQPKLSGFGVTPGGEDQAWIYREQMRDTWDEVPGTLEWLRKTSKKFSS